MKFIVTFLLIFMAGAYVIIFSMATAIDIQDVIISSLNEKVESQNDLIKELHGIDYEQREQYLFRAFEPKPIEY